MDTRLERDYDSESYQSPSGESVLQSSHTNPYEPITRRPSEETLEGYSPNKPHDEFLDPFLNFPSEYDNPNRSGGSGYGSQASSYAETELTLGLEASRLWDHDRSSRADHPGAPESQRGRISGSSTRDGSNVRISDRSPGERYTSNIEDDEDEPSDQVRISGEERVLPNGELIVSLYDDQMRNRDTNKTSSSNAVLEGFSLLSYDQVRDTWVSVHSRKMVEIKSNPDHA